ncbi:hypothetical protein OCUAc20_47500 (plasmid) [Acinetobacter baumannii]|nr:hypothetical protein OCUAc20_47500 [Acinetobacter baumannii]
MGCERNFKSPIKMAVTQNSGWAHNRLCVFDIKLKKITDLKSVIFEWTIARISVLNSFYK